MQRDSIRDNLTKEDIITAIHMEMDADMNQKSCFVLVEGSDDVEFIEGMFCEEVQCYESFSGKHGLEELIEHEELQSSRVIAVRDRDYVDTESLPERIFLYDYSCLEMMLLACEEITSSFYRIYYGGKSSREEYILHMMKELAPYSILRQKNEKNGGRINFQKVGFGKLIDEKENLEIQELFHRVGVDEDVLIQCKEEAVALEEEDLMYLTNGHDICLFLGCLPKKGQKQLGQEGVRLALLNSYRKSDFSQTELCNKIRQYQSVHNLKYVD